MIYNDENVEVKFLVAHQVEFKMVSYNFIIEPRSIRISQHNQSFI